MKVNGCQGVLTFIRHKYRIMPKGARTGYGRQIEEHGCDTVNIHHDALDIWSIKMLEAAQTTKSMRG